MARFDKVLLFLLDSVGVGALPDAERYGDKGAATVQHTLVSNPGLKLPNLAFAHQAHGKHREAHQHHAAN